jgi:hypothetical protein
MIPDFNSLFILTPPVFTYLFKRINQAEFNFKERPH